MSWIFSKFFGTNKRPSEVDDDARALKKRLVESNPPVNPYEGEPSFAFSTSIVDISAILSSAIIPRPLVLVTSFDEEGGLTIAPSNFCSIVSLYPAYITIGLPKDALPEDMGIVQNKEFTVNMVSSWMAEAATKTVGAYTLPDTEADLKTGITTTASTKVKVPRVAEAAVTLECRLRHKYDVKDRYGDVMSTVVIAEVVCAVVSNGVLVAAADGSRVVDAKLLQPVAALGNGLWGGVTDLHSFPPTETAPPISFAPATPGKPEAEREVAEVVAAAVAEALEQQPDAPCVKEVSVVLGEPADPTSREPTPVSVRVQHAE